MGVAGLVLAAGQGRRFGRPKALVELDGERLVDRAVRLLREAGCEPVVVVAGAAPLVVPDVEVIDNPDWMTGMGSSLRSGLAALQRLDASAAVIALVDTPWVGVDAVRRLLAAHGAGAALAIATYDGRRGRPVLLGREHWVGVVELAQADRGAKPYLEAHPDLVVEVPCDGTGRDDDIDEPADLEAGVRESSRHASDPADRG